MAENNIDGMNDDEPKKFTEEKINIPENKEEPPSVIYDTTDVAEQTELDKDKINSLRQEIKNVPERHDTLEHGIEHYEVDGVNIEVRWHLHTPDLTNKDTKVNSSAGIIFIPGWSSDSDSPSDEYLVEGFSEKIARNGGSFVLSVATRAEKVVHDSLFKEAEAIRMFIKDRELNDIILSGHSQGGDIAANLAYRIENESPDIKLNGLILLDAVGLYKQGKFELAEKFIRDMVGSLFGTGFSDRMRQASGDIVKGVEDEMKRSKLGYFKRLKNEISDMAQQNPRLKEIKSPVILVQGSKDLISAPKSMKKRALKEIKDEEPDISKSEQLIELHDKMLKKTFPKSSHTYWLEADKSGNHWAPLLRAEQISEAVLYLLRRIQRKSQATERNYNL